MSGPLAITQERVTEAYNLAMARHRDTTGEIRDPNLAYSIGYAVCAIFRTSTRSKNPDVLRQHKNAKTAVWNYYQARLDEKEAPAPSLQDLELPTSLVDYFKDQAPFLRECDHPLYGVLDPEDVPLLILEEIE